MPRVSLNPKIRDDVSSWATKLKSEDKLLSEGAIAAYLDTFRGRFGPDRLAKLDGTELLEVVHNQSNKESLVYWLEFKNDDEFPTPRFGSIAGGSALKFTIFYRKEANSWMGRSPGNVPVEISAEEALTLAQKHRDQLLAGVELLRALPADASDEQYERLQSEMDAKAPDVSDLSWGHKYFSLLFPDKLDNYHNADLQRFHLIKLLQLPPDKRGRYVLGGWYIDIAQQLGLHVNQLGAVLNARDGRQPKYWRVETSEDGRTPTFWPGMRDGHYVAIGWPELGDLAPIFAMSDPRSQIKNLLAEHYANEPQAKSLAEIARFVKDMDSGDLVAAANGSTVLGVGRVEPNSDYRYEPTDNFPHRRTVSWLDTESWSMPEQEALKSTFRELRILQNLLAIERRAASGTVGPQLKVTRPAASKPASITAQRLEGIPGRIQEVLDRKAQVILYGPPGTGKTYWADKAARDLAAYREHGEPFAMLTETTRPTVDEFVRTCTFHPAYGYEDFLEGYRPQSTNGQLIFTIRDGVFKRLCDDASRKPRSNFYLIIDEINRGDIPRIFGELLTVLEKSKRGKTVQLAVSGTPFRVPPNVFIIGTMNTADRSIALLDKALRRRFGFIECMPDVAVLNTASLEGLPLGPWLECINRSVRQKVGRDARNLQIGHSYLLDGEHPIAEFSRFVQVLRDEIIPLLEDYCYEDYAALGDILGTGLVDTVNQAIRSELFEDSNRADLVQALMQAYPEMATSRQAVASEAAAPPEDDDLTDTTVAGAK